MDGGTGGDGGANDGFGNGTDGGRRREWKWVVRRKGRKGKLTCLVCVLRKEGGEGTEFPQNKRSTGEQQNTNRT